MWRGRSRDVKRSQMRYSRWLQLYRFSNGPSEDKAAGLVLIMTVPHFAVQTSLKVGGSIGDWIFNCHVLSITKTVCLLNQWVVEIKLKRLIMSQTLWKV